ncbi:DUF4450 domain-containing protein [Telmatobacter bradus]|uniref:DUF4450 domain-containing protein n=1 Tax=Telmatobacter bradus TaxID=474953 RepID=UPI003B4336B5
MISRRAFLGSAVAFDTALFLSRIPAFAQVVTPRSAADSPEVQNGSIVPLLRGATARPMRYEPRNGAFVIQQGKEFFNRPLYGPNNAFRVDAGDLPEFSLYLPGHGGNLKFALRRKSAVVGLADAESVTAIYVAGRMRYQVSDRLIGNVVLHLEACTAASGSGLWVRAFAEGDAKDLELVWAFGGVSGRKGKRGGDIGCENKPVGEFFKVQPMECRNNMYTFAQNSVRVSSPAAEIFCEFPAAATLALADANQWASSWPQLLGAVESKPDLPVLIGSVVLAANTPLLFGLEQQSKNAEEPHADARAPLQKCFAARIAELDAIASTVAIHTPDPHIDCLPAALNIAANALWDEQQGCVMHGAVAWRNALAGWRGPYLLDALGAHERFQMHARHWINRQNTSPVTSANPAVGTPDAGSHLARSENLLHSNGDLSHNHYDMNLVFFDALLRHMKWTGDTSFAAEAWPALERHLAWEQRLFRRTFSTPQGELPLYEAYACIWASDNLQYNGAGVTHSSAYNYIAHRWAADLARQLGKNSSAYEDESNSIYEAMQRLLWLPEQGCMGEAKDLLGPQSVYRSPALWTVYHTIDSEAVTRKQAWQMLEERLQALEHVPVHGQGVPEGDWYMLSCSDWLPYVWSLNLLLLAENMHFALALWQAGHNEQAYRIFKGCLLDSMFMGLTPGNFHMTSALDVHRLEAQRDFGDAIGTSSRALIEGLFGIHPDLRVNELRIAPGFPAEWRHASIEHPDLSFQWSIENGEESYRVRTRFKKSVKLILSVRAHSTQLPHVLVNGVQGHAVFEKDAVGHPQITLQCAPASEWKIELEWGKEEAFALPEFCNYACGDKLQLPADTVAIDDPQQALRDGLISVPGNHVVFAQIKRGACQWWQPIRFHARQTVAPVLFAYENGPAETIDLAAHLNRKIPDIFNRSYAHPRSPYCSLSLPEQGYGGWAAFNLQPKIDDLGLRMAHGQLQTPMGIPFATPADPVQPNCRFLSWWQQDERSFELPLQGHAAALHLLMTGTTYPQASRMEHGRVTVTYADGGSSVLSLRNPETWWPIEQDYLIDDFLFVNRAPLPTRIDLKTGSVRQPGSTAFKKEGGMIDGGSATVLSLPLDPARALLSMRIEATLYGIVLALLAATLTRTSPGKP